ncbi:hypothetical protein [Bacteroides sp. 51]|uniref:hypothetical protein n=1 Tax=Bacteroides sp. 51 TaxID=2302938 RepID=UPI0013D85404|nr:hypothetical protein [Bacteroides sp. 51]NDV82446.1 hypothetical protein [Bacteroides sp. 51]
MKKHFLRQLAIIVILLFCLYPISAYSQKVQELEMGGELMLSDLDYSVSLGLSMNYNYWINQYWGVTLGGMVSHSKIDMVFDSPKDDKVFYSVDAPIFNLNGIVGLKFSSPVFKKVGIITDLKLMFDPIPFNYVDIHKRTFDTNYQYPEESGKNGLIFTRFNPSYTAELGLFYENRTIKRRGRISFGAGITNHNPYNAYYYSKVESINLKDHLKLKPNNVGFVLFLRLTGAT